MIDFRNRVALVTGAGRGLGFSYAKALAAHGATVIVQDSGASSDGEGVDPRIAEAAVQKITGAGGMAFAAAGALVSQTDARELVDGVLAEHRRLDIVIHNAGFVGYGTKMGKFHERQGMVRYQGADGGRTWPTRWRY